MAACAAVDDIGKEFEDWLNRASDNCIFMLQKTTEPDGTVTLKLLLKGEEEFTLHCPSGYPEYEGHFYVEAGRSINLWANALNEFLLDHKQRLTLSQVLNKALALYALEQRESDECSEEDDGCCDEGEEDEHTTGSFALSDEELFFPTDWEMQVARKKKRWAQKEAEIREEMKKKSKMVAGSADGGSLNASVQDKEQSQQIFTSSGASGILTNDLVKIMENEQISGITADPIDDNIYQWRVFLFNFDSDSSLAKDLEEVNRLFGYSSIELQLDFAIDLYPFYPPIVKVVRPRLQASMMQRVTNMEMLKLSFWNATKDMLSVLMDIKQFLQKWARLEVASERNERKRYPRGSYVDIEHDLLKLALVSEVNPRANTKYHLDMDLEPTVKGSNVQNKRKKKTKEYWAAGVGYGHPNRPEWDINAYIAAQQEKDKQVEIVLYQILLELKQLYANHAPQLKPCNLRRDALNNTSTEAESESIDPVEDMYNILEGSALIPFIEQYLKADSFLEICRHTSVYKVIVDIIKEISLQNQLVPLLGSLPDQNQSVYDLLKALENKANILLQHICKAGNGSIPKPLKKESSPSYPGSSSKKSKDSCFPLECIPDEVSTFSTDSGICIQSTAEEKLAREFQVLFRDVTVAFTRANMNPQREASDATGASSDSLSQSALDQEVEMMDISISTTEDEALQSLYTKALSNMQFSACDIAVDGAQCHHYSKEFKKQEALGQSQVFRIAQELTSLSSSLPLALSSSIFVRTDDDRLTLMKALITGPEGTPYSGGCYQFDIFFPSSYPHVPPLVNLQTTGGGTVRFNPNLYNSGRVCLSLLGTWEGQQGEQWNETASTVLQVLVSIQSLILVPDPYFNEPGYEQEIGTEVGTRHSNEYNTDVWYNNIKHAIIGQLHNPSQGFEEVVRTHFYLKKDRILQEIETWMKVNKSSRLEHLVRNLRQEFDRLQAPANLNNLCQNAASLAGDGINIQPEIHHMETQQPLHL